MKNFQKFYKQIAILYLIALICACSSVQPAQSFDERLAYGYATVTGLRNSAASSLNQGVITVSDAQYVLTSTDQARVGLDSAKLAESSSDLDTAQGKLTASLSILTQIQQYLTLKGVKQ